MSRFLYTLPWTVGSYQLIHHGGGPQFYCSQLCVHNLHHHGPDIRTLMMKKDSISETVVYLNHLLQLSAQQDFNGYNVVTNCTNTHNRIYSETSETRKSSVTTSNIGHFPHYLSYLAHGVVNKAPPFTPVVKCQTFTCFILTDEGWSSHAGIWELEVFMQVVQSWHKKQDY
jgi:hypothetical protein